MDNLTFTVWLCLAVFCGVCLVMAGVWVGNRLKSFLGWALGLFLMIWGASLIVLSLYSFTQVWTSIIKAHSIY